MKKLKYLLLIIPILILASCNKTSVVNVSSNRSISYDSYSISETNRDNALKSCISLYDKSSNYFFSGVITYEDRNYYYASTYGKQLTSGYIKFSTATLYNGESTNVTYIGTDSKNNIAVYKFKKSEELYVAKGSTKELIKGENVMSISTPTISDSSTVNTIKTGIISNISKGCFGTSIELSVSELGASIFDTDGNLLGMSTGVVSTSQDIAYEDELAYYHVIGLNQATTYELVYNVSMDIIKANSDITRGLMGITVTNYENAVLAYSSIINESDTPYVTIVSVSENSAASAHNIQAGFYVTKIDGNTVSRLTDLNYYMARKNKGDTVKLTCLNLSFMEIEYTLTLR